MNLQFSRKELTAIITLADMMIKADGKIDPREQITFSLEMTRLGVKQDNWAGLLADSQTMEPEVVLSTIGNLGNDGKKYVAAFLITLMAVDGNIDDSEKKLWNIISILCKLPTMSVKESLAVLGKR